MNEASNESVQNLPSLTGRTVIITRTEEGNFVLRSKLETNGASVIEFSVISVLPPESWDELDAAMRSMSTLDWIVFTSVSGVRFFFERLHAIGFDSEIERLRSSGKPKFACVGPSTAQALQSVGINPSLVPSKFLTSELGRELASRTDLRGKVVLLARSEISNREINQILSHAGAVLKDITVYRTVPNKESKTAKIFNGATDLIFTSPSAVRAFLESVSNEEIASKKIAVHCIGPVTAKTVIEKGLDVATVSEKHTIDGIVEKMCMYVNSR